MREDNFREYVIPLHVWVGVVWCEVGVVCVGGGVRWG